MSRLQNSSRSSTHLVEVTELPEDDQQLLVELDLLGGTRQVGLDQGIIQQSSQTFQDEAQVLVNKESTQTVTPDRRILLSDQCFTHLFPVDPGEVIHKEVVWSSRLEKRILNQYLGFS